MGGGQGVGRGGGKDSRLKVARRRMDRLRRPNSCLARPRKEKTNNTKNPPELVRPVVKLRSPASGRNGQ